MAKVRYEWQFRAGKYFYCNMATKTKIAGIIGAVVPENTQEDVWMFITSVHNKFDSIAEFDDLDAAKVHVAAIVALEGEELHD